MTNKLQPLRGTKDLLPQEFAIHNYIIDIAKKTANLYGYEAMSTPIIEYTNVFDRTLGETSDAVSKEMYSFFDRRNESIALRPEFTAGIIRAFISNSLTHNLPLKFFLSGPLFRYDRPQAGRQRQFHQVNFEYIGAEEPYTDAETIKLAHDFLSALEILQDLTLEINSLGCSESKELYSKKLVEYFSDYRLELSENSQRRLLKNPMRILDSKDENDQKIVKEAPLNSNFYTDSAKKYFDDVLKYLDSLQIKYIINPRLVRGLDYYCHTAFEFTTTKLGSQSSLIGGGRYDGLAEIMGGPHTPAIGFAAGIERLSLMREYFISKESPVYVIPIGDENLNICLNIADNLRANNIQALLDAKGKIDKRLTKALNKDAKYVIFIGDEERISAKYKIKNLRTRVEMSANISDIIKLIKSQK